MKDSSQRPLFFAVSTAFFPYIGGAEIALEEVVSRLPAYDRVVVTARMSRKLARREEYRGVSIIRIGFGFAGDKFLLPFGVIWHAWKNSRKRERVVLMSVMVSYGTLGVLLVSRFLKQSRMYIWLQEGDSEAHLTRGKFGLIGLGWRIVLPHVRVGALSASLAARARAHGARDIVIIPNGVEVSLFARDEKLQTLHKPLVLVTASRLVSKNGVRDIIESLVHMPTVRLIIAGDGPDRFMLEQKAQHVKVDTRIEWLGSVSHQELAKVFHRAQVFVRPSRSEGLGNAFLEAMAAGLVVLAPMVGGIPDFFRPEENGIEIISHDPVSIVRAVERIEHDDVLAKRLIRGGYETVKDYDWSRIVHTFSSWIAN